MKPSVHIRSVATSFLVGMLIGVGGSVAIAATAYSGWFSLGTTNGYSHDGQTWASSDSRAGGGLLRSTSGSAPTGWLGAEAQLTRNGALCASVSTFYNSAPATQLARSASGDCGSGNYRGMAYFYRWAGTYYSAAGWYFSPIVAW